MQEILNRFKNIKILVYGDLMLDRYWWGSVDRISPEAPVPVVALEKKDAVAGGAANVAANVVGLSASAFLVGVIGEDEDAAKLREILDRIGVSSEGLVTSESRPTCVKTRIIADDQQVARVDSEVTRPISPRLEQEVWQRIENTIDQADAVLVSDYAKGAVTTALLSKLIRLAKERDKAVYVDPKGRDYEKYRGSDLLTPNEKEAIDAAGFDERSEKAVIAAGKRILSEYGLKRLVVTRGKKGMVLFAPGAEPEEIETESRKVYDVTGAGDAVISTLTVSLCAGADFPQACRLSNIAGGIVVESVGTTAVTLEELAGEL